MPRPKVTEELRRRIAKACLYCQATKQKCDGLTPCSSCSKRGQSTSCAYSSHVRSYGAHRRRRSKPAEDPGQCSVDLSTTSSPHDGIPSHLQRPHEEPAQFTSVEVPIPKLSHKVYDTNGRVGMSQIRSLSSQATSLFSNMLTPNSIPRRLCRSIFPSTYPGNRGGRGRILDRCLECLSNGRAVTPFRCRLNDSASMEHCGFRGAYECLLRLGMKQKYSRVKGC